jgi:hypothetical protein
MKSHLGKVLLILGLGASGIFLAGCGGSPSVKSSSGSNYTKTFTKADQCFIELDPWLVYNANNQGSANNSVLLATKDHPMINEIFNITNAFHLDVAAFGVSRASNNADNALENWCHTHTAEFHQVAPTP